MANYQTHLTGGIIAGTAAALLAASQGIVTAAEMPFIALVGTWGGLAPDLDSDSSRPLRIMRDYATMIVPTVLLWRLPVLQETWLRAGCSWIVLAALARWPLVGIFKRMTIHRGIFHSIPAAGVFGGLAFLLAGRSDDVPLQIGAGVSAAAGYLTHLLLDEIWSVDFEGRRIKRSFGSALSLWKPDRVATGLAYLLLGFVALLTYEGLGGRRPEGIWTDNLGDAPLLMLQSAWAWLEVQVERLFDVDVAIQR
jgi:membrane-bound metal-dependent hydrolase YbcI (DUF457 family)